MPTPEQLHGSEAPERRAETSEQQRQMEALGVSVETRGPLMQLLEDMNQGALTKVPLLGGLLSALDGVLKYLKGLLPGQKQEIDTMRENNNGDLGKRMAAQLDALKAQRYVFAGRLGANIPGSNAKFNPGIDCIGVWWFLDEKFHWKTKDGQDINWQDFSKDGYTYTIPKLSDKYEDFKVTAANRAETVQQLRNMPDGTLLAFTSHVGVIRGGKLFNAKSPQAGVVESTIDEAYLTSRNKAGKEVMLPVRVLRPQHIRTA